MLQLIPFPNLRFQIRSHLKEYLKAHFYRLYPYHIVACTPGCLNLLLSSNPVLTCCFNVFYYCKNSLSGSRYYSSSYELDLPPMSLIVVFRHDLFNLFHLYLHNFFIWLIWQWWNYFKLRNLKISSSLYSKVCAPLSETTIKVFNILKLVNKIPCVNQII